jgi:hypothetical protein
MEYRALTLQAKTNSFSEILSKVGASEAVVGTGNALPNRIYWTYGLWDTGASHSSISKETAEVLGLEPMGEIAVVSARGEALENYYIVSITIPDLLFLPKLRVTEFVSNEAFGIIIGMDVISKGDFAITNVNGVSTFSFCVPGMETIDYQERILALESRAEGPNP